MTTAPSFARLTGLGVRVATIDSGVNPAHPHVSGVAGGVGIRANGETDDFLDYLGHGTAVAAAVREKAREADLYAVKVFDRALNTNIDRIVRAIEWCLARRIDIINLSLGTTNPAHRKRFESILARADELGVVLVAARESLPGCLAGVIGVGLDWQCPRDSYHCAWSGALPTFLASGHPRSIPGVAPERNLHGISFAVANMTGFAARARQGCANGGLAAVQQILLEHAREPDCLPYGISATSGPKTSA